MFGKTVYIRKDFWVVSQNFKKPDFYKGEVVSKRSKLDIDGVSCWSVELDDWNHRLYDIPADELALSLKELKILIKEKELEQQEKEDRFGKKEEKDKDKLYSDKTWRKGCEIVNETGKRIGKLCNCDFFTYTLSGLKVCRLHSKIFIDVTEDTSEYEEGSDDEFDFDDEDFIAEEDDGTKVINGKVYEYETESEDESEDDDYPESDFDNEDEIDDDDFVAPLRKRRTLVIDDSEDETDYETMDEFEENDVKKTNHKCEIL